MKIQTSRESHRADQRYSGVYQQQGRMITDADWNELMEIVTERRREALGDVVQNGVPRVGGLQIEAIQADDVTIRPGHLYAGGTLARLPGSDRVPYTDQADFPEAPALPAAAYKLYADVWERTLTSLEDPGVRDAALHGADTCARTQTMVQIKWCDAAVNPELPAANPKRGDAPLSLALRRTRAVVDPCDPCAAEELGDDPSRVGNYLFRLEVHDVEWDATPTDLTLLTLKWSSENGAEQYAVSSVPETFQGADWAYELFNGVTERHLGVQLADAADFPQRGALSAVYPDPIDQTKYPSVRRWDGFAVLTRSGGAWVVEGHDRGRPLTDSGDTSADGYVTLGDAFTANLRSIFLSIDLRDHVFVAGDYWTAPVREEVHRVDVPDAVLQAAPPTGIVHHYLTLGTVTFEDPAAPKLADPPDDLTRRRLDFPSLTTLMANDVGLENNCEKLYGAAENVQQALDNLCDIEAKDVAYDPTVKEARWKDISEITTTDPLVAPNTVQDALDTLVENLESSDIRYTVPTCSTDPAAARTFKDLLAVSGNTDVKALWDEVLCHLDASKIPYDPTVKQERWEDVTEAPLPTPARPDTVQDALDTLVENLESSDIGYTVPTDCEGGPAPRFKDMLGVSGSTTNLKALWDTVLCDLAAGVIPFDVPACPSDPLTVRSQLGIEAGPTSIATVLTRLLCDLNAADIPMDKDADLVPPLDEAGVRTVQDALNILAASRTGGGCASTVGFGGTYATLAEAFERLAAERTISLCLLPGMHAVDAALAPPALTSVKLTGVGGAASVIQLRDNLMLTAYEITLRDLGVRSLNPNVGLRLTASAVHADGCVFDRDPAIEREDALWARGFQSTSGEFSRAIAVDRRDNVVFTGYFDGTVDFGGGPLTAEGGLDLFIAKFDAEGRHVWSRNFKGSAADIGLVIGVDTQDNVMVTGFFSGVLNLGGAPLTAETGTHLFIAKFAPDGKHIWSRSFGGVGTTVPLGMAVDNQDAVVLTGYFSATLDFGGGPMTPAGGNDLFIVKFAPTGKHVWSRSFGGAGSELGTAVATDSKNNLLVTGQFSSPVDFGGGPLTPVGTDLFIAKLTTNGQHVWSRSFKGSGTKSGQAIAVDRKDNLVVTGQFSGTVDFGGGQLTSAGTDLFVAKFAAGGEHIWSNNFKGVGTETGQAIAVDSRNRVVVTGQFTGTLDFGGGALTSEGADLFLARFAADGRHMWSRNVKGVGSEAAYAIAVDSKDNVLLPGSFTGTVEVGGETLTAVGNNDLFLAKFVIPGPFEPLVTLAAPVDGSTEIHWAANRMAGLETVFALASSGVGGVISGNTISGVVSLMDALATPLTRDNELTFKGPVPNFVERGALRIAGNRIDRVVSKFSSPASPEAFRSIIAADNVFSRRENSFIGANVTMNGNQFMDSSAAKPSVAVVVCRYPIFVGNQVLVDAQIDVAAAEAPPVAANSVRLAVNQL